MTDHNTVADVLDDAADLIEKRGLWQASKPGTATGDCVVLAVAEAALEDVPLAMNAQDALAQLVGLADERGHCHGQDLIRWNDDPARTKQEVLDAFRAAAKAERKLADGIEP
jgi:hypothetical protein